LSEKDNNVEILTYLDIMAKVKPRQDVKDGKEGIDIKCHRCSHQWTFKGKIDKWKIFVQCPRCLTSVGLKPFLKQAASAAQ
jgi:hypothetical protein